MKVSVAKAKPFGGVELLVLDLGDERDGRG